MIKNILLFACSALFVGVRSWAQPVIVDGTNLATTGYSSPVMNGTATIAPGPGGPSLTWNFSSVAMTNVGTYLIENPTSTPVAGTYPSGNYALSITPTSSSALYSYYIVNSGAMLELANSVTTTPGSGVNYTPAPRKVLKFPFNYLDTFTSNYTSTTSSGYDFFEYDGYGTLITPWATYSNVVRVKCTYASSIGYAYNWYTLSPLLNVFSYSSLPNSYTGLSAVPTEVNTVRSSESVTIAPNPFTAYANIMIGGSVELNNAFVVVTDVIGRTVRQMPISSPVTIFERDDLRAGVYFYNVLNNGISIAKGKLIVQ